MVQLELDEQAIFENARNIASREARDAYLQQSCGSDHILNQRIVALLRAFDESQSFLESPPPGLDVDPTGSNVALTIDRPISEAPGTTIGPYKLLQQIGEGGMGVVFMAEQSRPIQRIVALKIIKPGMDTRQVIARFEAERQALAMMDHPNIARVLDAGTTDSGRPYFVMELVKGIPITQYCDEKQLSLRERLELFLPVCQAVQHAHQKGIIHRDIKPTNVLVAEYDNQAIPKVIDFGVAKATAQKLTERTMFTEFGQIIGTVEYMSPEQAKFNQIDIDTRSDIYSLGIVLYELLTGTTPFEAKRLREAAFDDVLRIIREEDPPKPSTRLTTLGQQAASTIAAQRCTDPQRLSDQLRGDLDWIVMKCLDKDRGRRYATANDLAEDVERYLNSESVLASPPSWITGLTKWVHRHRTASIAAGLLALVITLGSLVTSILLAQEQSATAQALSASEQNERALQITNKELDKERRRAEDNLKSARAAVDRMLTRVAGDLNDVPHLTQLQRALLEDAAEFYKQFLEQDAQDPALRHESALTYHRLGEIQNALGKFEIAEKTLGESSRLLDDLVQQFPADRAYRTDLIKAYATRAFSLIWSGRLPEHIEARSQQLLAAKALAAQHPSESAFAEIVANAESNLGGAYHVAGLPRQSEAHFREAVQILERLYRKHPQLQKNRDLQARCQLWLGFLLVELRRFEEAEPLVLAALTTRKELYAESPTSAGERKDLAQTTQKVGVMRYGQGKHDQALKLEREAIEIYEKLLDDLPDVNEHRRQLAVALNQVALVHAAMGSLDEALDALRRAVFHRRILAEKSPNSMEYQNGAGWSHFDLGKFMQAAGHEAEAVEEYRQAQRYFELAVDRFPTYRSNYHLANLLATCPAPQFQDPQRAMRHARRALQLTPELAEAWRVLAIAQYRVGNWAAADDSFSRSFHLQPNREFLEDYFYRAIIAWQLENRKEAKHWQQAGLNLWSREHPMPWVVELRDHAATMLGVDTPGAASEASQ